MKRFSMILFVLAICEKSFSQEDKLTFEGTTRISRQLTPKQVVDSLNKTFPDAKSIKYFKTPPDAAKNGWTVSEEDNLDPNAEIDYYTISFKRSNMQYYGLYRADGKLVRSKLEKSVQTLPEPVMLSLQTIGQLHPGYKVKSKTYYHNQEGSGDKQYYEIIAEKGKQKKKLFYQADGTLIKVKG